VKMVKAGQRLSSLDQVPPPTVPIPTHHSMFLMQPSAPFFPMVSAGRIPAGVDPSVAMQLLRPHGGVAPGGMVGVAGDGKPAAVATSASSNFMVKFILFLSFFRVIVKVFSMWTRKMNAIVGNKCNVSIYISNSHILQFKNFPSIAILW